MVKNLIFVSFLFIAIFMQFSCENNSTESIVNVPEVTTADVSEITQSTAQCGGTITSDGGATVTAQGVCWSTNQTPTVANDKTTDGTGAGSFTSNITGLIPGTTYYIRAYATNNVGTGYGSAKSFVTNNVPEVTTADVSEITQSTAQCGGTITFDGGATITARGVCWSTNQTPTVANDKTTDGIGVGNYTSNITGLIPGTTYYIRAYATNNVGTGYGSRWSFTTEEIESITDIDGNVYQVVKIGNQFWLAENLKVTHYRNGDPIPNVTDGQQWDRLTNGAYCNFGNDANNANTYGRLYNGYAVNDSRNIAPAGWHVPSDDEWKTLEMYLGMNQSEADNQGWGRGTDEGGKLKEAGTTHWNSPNTGATNESGFTALPGGMRSIYFWYKGRFGYFWASTAWLRQLADNNSRVNRDNRGLSNGFSVRCVMD